MCTKDDFEPVIPEIRHYAKHTPGASPTVTEKLLMRDVEEYLVTVQQAGVRTVPIGEIFSRVKELCEEYTLGHNRSDSRHFICDVVAQHNSDVDQYHATEIYLHCLNRDSPILVIYDRTITNETTKK